MNTYIVTIKIEVEAETKIDAIARGALLIGNGYGETKPYELPEDGAIAIDAESLGA